MADWLALSLGELLSFEYGSALGAEERTGEGCPVFGSNGVVGHHATSLVSGPGIVVGRKGSAGALAWSDSDFWPIDTTYWVKPKTNVDLRWIFDALRRCGLERLHSSTGVPGLNRDDAYERQVPVPPLEEQRRIAKILASIDETVRAIERVVAKLEMLRSGLAQSTFDAVEAPSARLRDVASLTSGSTPGRDRDDYWNGKIPWVKTGEVGGNRIESTEEFITDRALAECPLGFYPVGTVLVAMYGQGATRGRVAMLGVPATTNQACAAINAAPEVLDGSSR